MPAVLRPGMTVMGKKRRINPQTVSGFPMWNTYAGLDVKACVKELNAARKLSRLKGRKSHVHRKRPLDRSNLCHRLRGEHSIQRDRVRCAFDRCRVLGLQIDRCDDERVLDELLSVFELNLSILQELHANDQINRLLILEAARGSTLVVSRI